MSHTFTIEEHVRSNVFAGLVTGMLIFLASLLVTGCMGAAPSSQPTMRLPQTQPPLPQPQTRQNPNRLPSPPTSSGPPMPSQNNPGQQGAGMPSTPSSSSMPGMPSPPSGSQMPSPPTSSPSSSQDNSSSQSSRNESSRNRGSSQGQGSADQRSGVWIPDVPGLPPIADDMRRDDEQNEGDGDADSDGGQGLPSDGRTQTSANNEEGGDGETQDQRSGDASQSGSQAGATEGQDRHGIPSTGIGDESQGGQEEEGESVTDAGLLGSEQGTDNETWDPNSQPNNGESRIPITNDSPPREHVDRSGPILQGGWVVSNEIPDTEKVRDQSDVEGNEDEGSEEPAQSAIDNELEATLANIDGSIQSDREEHASKINEQVGGVALPSGPGNPQTGALDSGEEGAQREVGGTSQQRIPNANGSDITGAEGSSVGLPRSQGAINEADIPDARDDDVVARQIREAALAEKDPELRAAMWEELRRYLANRK